MRGRLRSFGHPSGSPRLRTEASANYSRTRPCLCKVGGRCRSRCERGSRPAVEELRGGRRGRSYVDCETQGGMKTASQTCQEGPVANVYDIRQLHPGNKNTQRAGVRYGYMCTVLQSETCESLGNVQVVAGRRPGQSRRAQGSRDGGDSDSGGYNASWA
ncbi:hypothetical protein EXIGLDRAFT_351272 [Exidia glandulosa HHB12029]|uniref:Uncharacterized protein n=1 Tax=Exidia glandulosa HHB12029 TaxID=1314781 RepID=A0A166MR88_EXIGL|nr:hypothetical protein EXIGLDRAFT_43751 [Exidia glandulosa HHB12029]KZV82231.1 hypothetical protein EXIGLDRAFT_351272 [Exidia glandulosa HHB12029]